MGSVATTHKDKYREPFAPVMPDVEFVRFNDIEDLKAKFTNDVCGICIEVLQGEGGIHPVSKAFFAAARARGYGYMNVTDHSPAVGFGMGLDAGRMREQVERVRALAETLAPDFVLLAGAEVDILRDGSLDYSDELLAELDVVVASVHASHRLSAADQTKRICAALENPHVDVLGHPTGRRIGSREPNPLDIEAVIAKAVETRTIVEVSCQPERLDLRDTHVRLAVEAGALLAVDTDAHSVAALDYLRYGVATARRGWATAANVVNTREWPELQAQLGP